MSWRYLLGWVLVVGALGAAILEMAARGVVSNGHWMMSATDVWSALWPENLRRAQAAVGRWPLADLWEVLMATLLSLPAWLLFGVPGGVLVWRYHPLRGQTGDIDEDSYFLFDRLSKRAREEGEGDDAPQPTVLPPRFPDHAEEGDDKDADNLPGPFRSLELPGQEPDDKPPRGGRA